MIAIVFWHARSVAADADDYAAAIAAFHRRLNETKPDGFRYSATFRVQPLPWFSPESEVFEDWYVMRGFFGIDRLDELVLGGNTDPSHRFLMAHTAAASASILSLNAGGIRIHDMPEAYWMQNAGTADGNDVVTVAKSCNPGGKVGFWTRSMALGPRQHCLLSSAPVELPPQYRVQAAHREIVWRP